MALDYLKLIFEVVIAGATVGSLLYGGWRAIRKHVTPYLEGLAVLPTICQTMPSPARMHAMEQTLASIAKEVRPNGGASLRDSVERTEKSVAILGGVMRAHHSADDTYARFEADGIGLWSWANPTLLHWVERSMHEVDGYGWINSVGLDDRTRIRDEWERAVAERREFSARFHLRTTRGREFLVECIATPVPNNGDQVERWVGVIKRISPTSSAKAS